MRSFDIQGKKDLACQRKWGVSKNFLASAIFDNIQDILMERCAFYSHKKSVRKQDMMESLVLFVKTRFWDPRDWETWGAALRNWRNRMYRGGGGILL